MSSGFEIETELTVHALELCMPRAEEPTAYSERPSGSFSKLNTYRDGARILAPSPISCATNGPGFFGIAGLG